MKNRCLAMFFGLLGIAALLVVGCELKSADSTIREVGVDFSGYYDSTATNADFVSPANSGGRVTSFNLRQTGDQLEAIDNHQYVFRGTIGEAQSDGGTATASFTLEGETTAGQSVTIAGTLAGQGGSATIKGTWIEPDRYCYLNGDASINPIPTNTGSDVTISASTSTITSNNATATLTANGGSGSYTAWSVSDGGKGSVSPTSGKTVTYTRLAAGNVTVTVTDSASRQGSIQISQP